MPKRETNVKWQLNQQQQKEPLWGKKWLEKKSIKRDKIGERERERERELTFFAMNNLEGIGERGGNEVKEIYKKIKLEEKE